jgi:alpha-D-ribose 1-methylphosphonate 5-triphosphate synthase subunit PhnG
MRLGDDRVATLAAAVCDAVASAGGAFAADVEQLCTVTQLRRAERQTAEWHAIAPTIVAFEELT